ncbi:MAG: 7-carboxy-7-deazaguanine synthase [Deltaproteobacteria bacterium HGW-Deltaproteobacteria-6]|jgi:7-carboxy-7-deazaguanine synthase (Cx14CxxC type)|nr:MAG: 7-carboxy-7-deazaguanine synthase [Deltaproteobacteria bacterium HGW-Deltaproteobacteria-6]
MYSVKEIFYSIQGEGYYSGRPAVFCRFAGCNLWSGKEEDRKDALCPFCDTDFAGTDGTDGGVYETAGLLVRKISQHWPQSNGRRFVVCTGGEPLLQVDDALIAALREEKFEIAVETNGTIVAPAGIDWICVSPKAGVELAQSGGDELKLVYPQDGALPEKYTSLNFRHFFLQPMDGVAREEATRQTLEYVLAHPQWRISLQLHKILGVR